MFLEVDVSDSINWYLTQFLSMIINSVNLLKSVIIFHVGQNSISLFDFIIGLTIIEFFLGTFLFFAPNLSRSDV